MSLQEFDSLIDRMNLALEYAENLGQYVEAARILYQINEQLPDDLQMSLDELEDPAEAKNFLAKNKYEIKSMISEYRQKLMGF